MACKKINDLPPCEAEDIRPIIIGLYKRKAITKSDKDICFSALDAGYGVSIQLFPVFSHSTFIKNKVSISIEKNILI